MRQLILLYWGCVFLIYLSQIYYPGEQMLDSSKMRMRHFLLYKADIFIVLTIAWICCFSFLRESYNDTLTYIDGFDAAVSLSEGFESGMFTKWFDNPMSMLYRSLIRSFTDNYHIYFFVPALLNSFAVVKLFKRYSINPAFSMLIYFSIGTYVTYIAAMKQCFAMFFLLMALPYAIEKKYVRFYLLVVVAILFHTHAFMFAILPLLFGKPWGKTIWIGLGVTLLSMATYDVTLGAFMEYAQSLGALVAESEVFDGHQINFLRVIVYWIPGILALVFRRRLFSDSSRTENLFVNMAIVSAFILMIGLVEGANLYARMAAYFEIAVAISMPWMIKKLFTKESAQLVTGIAVVLYFGYFLYEFGISKGFGSDYSATTLWRFIVSLFRG